jgi:hypothetical protein
MKLMAGLLLCLGGLLLTPFPPQNSGWRGVVPLHSTRADVERLIGKPNLDGTHYDFEDERASILYTREPCSGGQQGAYNVPRNTVVGIDVVPKRRLLLSELNLDPDEYKRSPGGNSGAELASYHSEKAGVTYVAYVGGKDDGVIRIIFYRPRAEDARLHCPTPPGLSGVDRNPESQSASENTGAFGECPTVDIEGSSDKTSQGGVYLLSASISGGDPRFTPTYKWSVSAGVIASGQGTPSVKIDMNGTDCRQVTVTLEVGGMMPKGCERIKTYTIEPPKP